MLAAPCAGEEAALERMGYLLRGSPVRIVAPDEFLDPVTDCLILEPVTLLNTDTTLDRLTLQEWLRAGALPRLFLSIGALPEPLAMPPLVAAHTGDTACCLLAVAACP